MARMPERGNFYFSFDTAFFSDKKIKILKARYGSDGVLLYIYLLCCIYKEGYYIQADDDFIYILSDDLNMGSDKAGQILNFLLERSLFDDTLFKSDKVLTSHGIQIRYQKAVKSRAVKNPITVNRRFWLLSEEETETFIKVPPCEDNSGKNGDYSENNPDNSKNNATKKIKEKKKKEKNTNAREIVDSIKALFNEVCRSLPPVSDMEDYPRDRKVLELWNLHPDMERFRAVFTAAEESDFLCRRAPGKQFQASFDWLMEQQNFVKVYEGNYKNAAGPQTAGTRSYDLDELDRFWNEVPKFG